MDLPEQGGPRMKIRRGPWAGVEVSVGAATVVLGIRVVIAVLLVLGAVHVPCTDFVCVCMKQRKPEGIGCLYMLTPVYANVHSGAFTYIAGIKRLSGTG